MDHPANTSNNATPRGEFVLIRKGVLPKREVVEYLNFYFDVMWSLRPVVYRSTGTEAGRPS